MLPEYDFTRQKGVRGKYYHAYRQGHTVKIYREDGTVSIQYFTRGKIMGSLHESPDVIEVLKVARSFPAMERLKLAKLLLESVLPDENEDETDWSNMSLAALQKEWDNPEDAVYDNWGELSKGT